jgi:hypothetical protein
MRRRFFDRGEHLIESRHIHLERQSSAAQSLDFAWQAGVGMDVAQAQCDVGSGVSQGERDRAAEASCRAVNQRRLACQVE